MEAEVVLFDAQKKKMSGLCDEHGFSFLFETGYPFRLTISPVQKQYEQGKLLDDGAKEETKIDPKAKMILIFGEGKLSTKIEGGTFCMEKTLRSKIENIFQKMVGFYLQYEHRWVIEHKALKKNMVPEMPDVDEAVAGEGEPVEDFED